MNQSLLIAGIVCGFLLVCVLFESLLITAFHITRFARALLHAALVNSASLLMVYGVWPVISRMDIDEDKVFPLLPILLGIVILVEGLLLKILNRQQTWLRVGLVSVVMNVVSMAILYFFLTLL